jgi:hypothetical protein
MRWIEMETSGLFYSIFVAGMLSKSVLFNSKQFPNEISAGWMRQADFPAPPGLVSMV